MFNDDGSLKTRNRKNIYTLDTSGNGWFAGNVTVGTNKDTLATQAWVNTNINASKITVDSVLSTTSTNPVQNAIITKKVNGIDSLLSDTIDQIDEIDSSLSDTIEQVNGINTSLSATIEQVNTTNTFLSMTIEDIDEICGSSIVAATLSEVTF